MLYELKVFDNHKIPKKYRGKQLIYNPKQYVSSGQCIGAYVIAKKWKYASSGIESKTGRIVVGYQIKHPVRNDYINEKIYLKESEFILIPLKSDGAVKN